MDSNQSNVDYGHQYDHEPVTRDRIAERCVQFERNFIEFWKNFEEDGVPSVVINRPILVNAVTSYFSDIQRLKEYHLEPIRKADRFKVAGYTMKWLAKCRPIQLDESHFAGADEEKEKVLLLANAIFAFSNALNFANIDSSMVPGQVASDIIYDLQYRSVEGTVLAQMSKFMAALWPVDEKSRPVWR